MESHFHPRRTDTNQGDEVLHLPVIVESAESSPQAASAAALQIRKFLSKENFSRPQVQYNAVMLIRILADNPGASFTKNLDSKFAGTVKDLLRNSRDQSVQQIARETLSALYQEKAYDTNLATLFAMWTKEMPNQPKPVPYARTMRVPPPDQGMYGGYGGVQQPDHFARGSRSHGHGLPPPAELAARVEEAKTSAKLLQQLVQSTPPMELQTNDLVKEFGQRVSAAQRSVQGYINCDNPPPDEDTLQTLIETSEQLSLAASKHQRAVLQARRLVGPASPPVAPAGGNVPILQAPALPIRTQSNGITQTSRPQQPSPQPPASQPTYLPPSGPPPGHARTPTDDGEDTLYNAPPVPPTSMQQSLQRRNVPKQPPTKIGYGGEQPASTKPSLPPMSLNSEPIEMPSTRRTPPSQSREEDPFSDEYASGQRGEPQAHGALDAGSSSYSTPQRNLSLAARSEVSDRTDTSTGPTGPMGQGRAGGDEQAFTGLGSVSPLYERSPPRNTGDRYRY